MGFLGGLKKALFPGPLGAVTRTAALGPAGALFSRRRGQQGAPGAPPRPMGIGQTMGQRQPQPPQIGGIGQALGGQAAQMGQWQPPQPQDPGLPMGLAQPQQMGFSQPQPPTQQMGQWQPQAPAQQQMGGTPPQSELGAGIERMRRMADIGRRFGGFGQE
jgi:hypothetical protein